MALQTDYSYDAVGNRQTRDVGGTLETYAYDAFSNRLDTVTAGGVTRTLGYSGSGNTDSDDNGAGTVLTNIYDSTDRLAEVKNGAATVAEYLYNAGGQRVAKIEGATTTHYLYGKAGALFAEADGTTGTVQAEYIWIGGMPLAYIVGGTIYYVHADHLGTPQRVADAAGAVVWDADYRPFGEATTSGALTFNLRFPGQYFDAETGMHYNFFRDYDPTTGRYIQSDPIRLRGGWNTYAYVGGKPVTLVDEYGLKAVRSRDVEFSRYTEAFISWRGTTLEDGDESHSKYVRYEADVAEDCELFGEPDEFYTTQTLHTPPPRRKGSRWLIVNILRIEYVYNYRMWKEISFPIKREGSCAEPARWYWGLESSMLICAKKNERIQMESGWIPM